MKKTALVLISSLICIFDASADNFGTVSATGNISSSGGNIRANAGYVYGDSSLQSGGFITAGGYIKTTSGDISATSGNVTASGYIKSTGGAVYATTYLQAVQNLAVGTTGSFGGLVHSNGLETGGSALSAGNTNSAAIGLAATASSYSSLVVGRYNVLEGTPGSWVTTVGAKEPLFVVGNGTTTATADRNNAFTVYKDGTVTMSKAQGDIAMGQFGN